MKRCAWANTPLSIRYHDEEWGVPKNDDRALFEQLVLEGAQAGLSWETILRKRDAYRLAFANFDYDRVARFGSREMERLLRDAGIVRNRAKIASAISNARAIQKVRAEFGSFAAYLLQFTGSHAGEEPVWKALSKDLRLRGFTFTGPTIVRAYLQAIGALDEHAAGCFRGPSGV